MIIKNYSVEKLYKLSQKRKMIVFGAGDNCEKFFERYKSWNFTQYIDCIVDNSSEKWGKKVLINKIEYEIKNPTILDNIDFRKYIIFITPFAYKPILGQLQAKYVNKKLLCCTVPEKIYSIENVFELLMKNLPLKNMLILRGEGDTCENAMALAEYMRRKKYNKKYKLIWACNEPEKFVKATEKHIKWNALNNSQSKKERLEYYYYVYRAKYLIFENTYIEKAREEQISVYLKHGEMPLKVTKGLIVMPEELSFTIAASEFSKKIMSEQYSINKERIFKCGQPRTDVLYSKDEDSEVVKYLKINKYNKTIVWMPTFRKHCNGIRNDSRMEFNMGVPILYSESIFLKLTEYLQKENIQIILKLHKYQDMSCINVIENDNFKILTQNQIDKWGLTTHRMLRYADALITDYSTIAFDYMLLDRPLGYTIDDMEEYKLGFIQEDILELMPGRKIHTIEEFIAFINNVAVGCDEFRDKRNETKDKVAHLSNGESCYELCEHLGIR